MDEACAFIRLNEQGFDLLVQVQPGAKKTEIIGEFNGRLKVKLNAPPIDGRANEELVALFSDIFGCAKRKISISHGLTSKLKTVRCIGLDLSRADVSALLSKIGAKKE